MLAGCVAPAPTSHVTTTGTLAGSWPGLEGAAAQIETGPRGSMLAIVLTPQPDACTALADGAAGAVTVQLSLSKAGTSSLFAPGTELGPYTSDGTTAGPWVGILVSDQAAQCAVATGTTTLTASDPTGYEGTFELELAGEQLRGTFAAPACTWPSARPCP